MSHDPRIAAAARRARAWLNDGTEVVLVGIRTRTHDGHRHTVGQARIQLPDGRQRTVRLADIAGIEGIT